VIDKGGRAFIPPTMLGPQRVLPRSEQKTRLHLDMRPMNSKARINGPDAERTYPRTENSICEPRGYYHSLRAIRCALSLIPTAESASSIGIPERKVHPEVAPSQFEINYNSAGSGGLHADHIQLTSYCRQVARIWG